MKKEASAGTYQLENGLWAYRFKVLIDGKEVAKRKYTDENGNKLKTQAQAIKARERAIAKARIESKQKKPTLRRTVEQIYEEYCEKGRSDRAYQTIRKQESLWTIHLKERFGKRYIDEISVAEVNDYLAELYYEDGLSFRYVEGFLKMFYLIFGQAYSRNYMDGDSYNKLCKNKDTKIHMPKLKVDDDTEIKYFSREETAILPYSRKSASYTDLHIHYWSCGSAYAQRQWDCPP